MENTLEITRNFNNCVKAFRTEILTKTNHLIEWYNDRVEFQSRGHPHIHGLAWTDLDEADNKYPGIKNAYEILKQ